VRAAATHAKRVLEAVTAKCAVMERVLTVIVAAGSVSSLTVAHGRPFVASVEGIPIYRYMLRHTSTTHATRAEVWLVQPSGAVRIAVRLLEHGAAQRTAP